MSPRWIRASVFAAFAGLAHAQSPAVLGRNDADFASALLRGGYTDLAERLCTLLQTQGNLPPEEAIGVKALHLDLRLDLALRESDLFKRKELLTRILEEKEDIVRQYSGRKVAEETSSTLPEVYQKLGETISRAIQAEKDTGLIMQLQKEGGDVFKAAEAKLEARIKELNDLIAESTTTNPKLEEALTTARYNLPRTRYFHALLYGKSDTTTRDVHLNEAIAGFQEFGLDYGDTIFGYEGLIYEGLCYKEQENWDDAFQAFDDAINLRDQFTLDSKGVYSDMGAIVADLVSWAVLQKVTLQLERGLTNPAIAEAKTFLDTTPDVDLTRHGLAVRAQLAGAYLKAGDTRNAGAQADRIVAADPRGPWGAEGRRIQGQLLQAGGAMDPANVLQIAQTLIGQGEVEQGLRIAQRAIEAASKDSKSAGVGVDAWLLIGSTYLSREMVHEATVAFDAAVDRFGNDEKAAEAVFQSMRAYTRLQRDEKKNYYKSRAEERQRQLATKFASHPRAWEAQLFEADQLAAEGKHVEAAEQYGRVQPSAPSYLLAQAKAGESYFLHAFELFKNEARKGEGKTFSGQAEALLKKAMAEADKEHDATLDLARKTSLSGIGRLARLRLAQLYLHKDVGRAAEVVPLLEGADERFSASPEVVAQFWSFRIEALRELGRYDEAIALLEALIRRDPDSRAIGTAAGNLARALDARSDELRDKEKKPREADEMRKRAANFYAVAGRALLKVEPLNVRAVEDTAGRLFTLGLIVNEVPESQEMFIGWDPRKTKDPANWNLAAELLTKALQAQPGYKMEILLGRTHGFLGRYEEAANVLGALFDREEIYDAQKKTINRRVQQSKPDLLYAWFEYGVAEHFVAAKSQDLDRFRRAQVILSTMARNLTPNTANWWQAKYHEVANFASSGNYVDACFALNDLDRTTSGFGQEFGLDGAFARLREELKDRCK
ncbi:MAG: tetratricopeptide repeat protein [Planctomycetes bacterium]|nr:tetratricopeptide repeat protein [Planctomycetota bacterium]